MTMLTDDELAARGAAIVRSVSVEPPLALRERIEAERSRVRPRVRRRQLGLAGALTATAAVALAVVLAVGGGSGAPSLDEAAALSARSPSGAAPQEQGKVLAAAHAGVSFPNWTPRFGWRAAGQRVDRLDGRSARTVIYAKGANTVGYTIVDGDRLEGTGSESVEDGRRVITFERGGHTCVVSGSPAVKRDVLLKLARWQPA